MLIALRCDGGDVLGAGHVGRCLPVAHALARAGHEPVMVGDHDGVALRLLEHAGVARRPPARDEPCGIPADVEAALVDVYGQGDGQRRAAAALRPLVVVRDALDPTPPPPGAAYLDYHLDAVPPASAGIALCGPDYAPLDPRVAAARQGPHDGGLLVALGGSTVGTTALEPLLGALLDAGHERLLVAGALVPEPRPGVEHVGPLPGLQDVLGEVSGICCGASVTAYEASAAGTAALLVVLVDNQERVGRVFAPLTPVLDVRGEPRRHSSPAVAPAAGPLGVGGPGPRAAVADGFAAARDAAGGLAGSSLPSRGPALVDGHGAARVRDALLALVAGDHPPEPLRQRPATTADADLLRRWRNDPGVRAVSVSSDPIAADEHAGWLRRVLADPDRTLLVVERGGVPVATVRFDRDAGSAEAEISVTVDPAARATGLGRRILRESTERELSSRPALRRVTALVHADNAASLRAFGAAGYRPAGTHGAWRTLEAVR
ncbi:bifunctional UDP-2,4-diacetamido-2,4,6-trideoxy-beta-L-altropyranose hydrolase/GNAT family N-acetyltransferase [Patulibacter sp.]|uniref:bifunctional UDP-2,4-diacetamido-2,4,6-trideoxy-beta-L-altropyranose hydrolase/GNAT family N-acetyltransferase n=1 Tax=Patulibacter sp. TaxID=1912859 RepID=UPI0027185632|nr:bifunctional UDP-2,4-diacetamido-2,4,6-trideoxy-beta-L-altropyranose hydrolase/GNAT family N-acetyltransferase [Patulibacter sp.]MDO9408804.1 bifunctional UDP-2,4-diacetamido-2,4,6-trideoxy-beta-L-altropyranose hydrolase/GNAT family N-acetyltransferase [Patulibacter sp.]